ncbi:MAG: hypothetical protein AB1611_09880 [bacterium]
MCRNSSKKTYTTLWETAFFLIIALLLLIALPSPPGHCHQEKVNFGLTGRFGYNGAIICGEIYRHRSRGQTYVYCGTQEGLVIIDITDPASPRMVSFFEFGKVHAISFYHPSGEASEFALLLKETGDTGEMVTLSIDDPAHPACAGRYSFPEYPRRISVFDHYACVANESRGLVILDLRDPARPVYAGGYHTPGQARDVAIFGHYACVADGPRGLTVIDLTNPADPRYAGENPLDIKDLGPWIEHKKNASTVAMYDHYACLGFQSKGGVAIVDLSDPANPSLVSWFTTEGEARKIAVSGHYAYVADDSKGLVIIDLHDPVKPARVDSAMTGQEGIPESGSEGGARDIAVSGSFASLVSRWGSSLAILTLPDPSAPSVAGRYTTEGYARAVAVSGHHALVADEKNGLMIVEVTDPARPVLAGHCCTAGSASDLAVFGNYACVADGPRGLAIIDLSDPVRPRQAGGYHDQRMVAWDVAVSSRYAYVAADRQGLVILDLSDPDHPTLAGSCATGGTAYGLAVSGDYAYVAVWNGLVIVNIHDPVHPVLSGRYNHADLTAALDVAVSGNHAFVAAGASGLFIIDVSDPESPKLAARYNPPTLENHKSGVQRVTLSGGHAYLAAGTDGLVVLDVSDPARPILCGREDTLGLASGIAIHEDYEDYAFVADADGGLAIYRIIDSPAPSGNLIVLPSGPASAANPLWLPGQTLANLACSTFLDQGFPRYSLYYLSPDPYPDLDQNGFPDPLLVRDSDPSAADLDHALTDWAVNRLDSGPLYLYFPGQGTGETYRILGDETIRSGNSGNLPDQEQDDTGSLKDWLDSFQKETGRDVICLLEFASSGSFAARLMDSNTAPCTRTIISCTDSGPSSLDPDGRFSFTGQFLRLLRTSWSSPRPGLFSGSGPEAQGLRISLLQALFSEARESFWASGLPWNTQPPQMITARGANTLVSISLSVADSSSRSTAATGSDSDIVGPAPVTITDPGQRLVLRATGHYLDGSSRDLSGCVYYQASDPSILSVTQEGEIYPDPNTGYNGLAFVMATIIDPDFAQSGEGDSIGHPHPVSPLKGEESRGILRKGEKRKDTPPLGGITGRIPVRVAMPAGKEKNTLPRAIIVAGRANDPAGYDYLGEIISHTASYAYDTFIERGYSPQNVCYLNHDQTQPGVVHLSPDQTFAQVLEAIFTRADNPYLDLEGLTDLTILLIDHGQRNTFFLGPDSDQTISPVILDQWLDSLQKRCPSARITVIVEACFSGGFLDPLIRGAEKRTVIASTDDVDTYLAADGMVSLTSFLFTHLRSGASFQDAFDQARTELASVSWGGLQHPVLKSTEGSQTADQLYLGSPFFLSQGQPQILQVSGLSDPNHPLVPRKPVELWARVADHEGAPVTSVFALIGNSQAAVRFSGSSQTPLMAADMTRVDLAYNPDRGRYEGVYEGFPSSGPYTVLFMARDSTGMFSHPRTVYPKVEGGDQASSPAEYALLVYDDDCPECARQAELAQWVLEKRRVPKENIIKLCGRENLSSQMAFLLTGPAESASPASSAPLDHLLLFLISGGDLADLDGPALSRKLDEIQQARGCTIISLIDADDADRFLPILKGPGRITISSGGTGDSASADLSFSRFFFSGIYRGLDVFRAYQAACLAVSYFSGTRPLPLLDDNGNGQGPEYGPDYDGRLASGIYLGAPFEPLPPAPEIDLSPCVYLDGRTGRIAPIQVRAQDAGSRVFALITAPDGSSSPVDLMYDPNTGMFGAEYAGFTDKGVYRVVAYAEGQSGLTDFGETRYIVLWPDEFEADDSRERATALLVNQPCREHSFHDPSDEDWSYFYAYAGLSYEVKVSTNWSGCPVRVEVLSPDGSPVGESSPSVGFTALESGFHLVRISSTCADLPADYPSYGLSVISLAAGTGGAWGWVRDADTGAGIVGATICSAAGQCTTSLEEWRSQDPSAAIRHVDAGFYFMDALPRASAGLTLTARAIGYLPHSEVIFDYDEDILSLTFYLHRDPETPYQQPPTDPVTVQRTVGIMSREGAKIRVNVPLSEGLNLFSHPNAAPSPPYSVKDFMGTYGQADQAEGPCFSGIGHYNAALGRQETCFFVPPAQGASGTWSPNCSNPFPMVSGEGYALYMRRGRTLNFPLPMPNPPIDLKQGQNWVGISDPPSGYSSYLMLQDIGSAREVSSIFGFDPETGRWKITYWDHDRPAGDNFPIRPGVGCIVHMTGERLKWLPGRRK